MDETLAQARHEDATWGPDKLKLFHTLLFSFRIFNLRKARVQRKRKEN